ncbi:MAG: hypothetical protein RR595_00090 [Lysinibacillus sp.]
MRNIFTEEINRRIAGKSLPFTLCPAYAGCPIGCRENDIGVLKVEIGYDLYISRYPKGADAQVGKLVKVQELYTLIDKIVEVYSEHGKKCESFFKFVNRYSFDTLTDQMLLNKKTELIYNMCRKNSVFSF